MPVWKLWRSTCTVESQIIGTICRHCTLMEQVKSSQVAFIMIVTSAQIVQYRYKSVEMLKLRWSCAFYCISFISVAALGMLFSDTTICQSIDDKKSCQKLQLVTSQISPITLIRLCDQCYRSVNRPTCKSIPNIIVGVAISKTFLLFFFWLMFMFIVVINFFLFFFFFFFFLSIFVCLYLSLSSEASDSVLCGSA